MTPVDRAAKIVAAYDALREAVHNLLYRGDRGDAEKLAELVPLELAKKP